MLNTNCPFEVTPLDQSSIIQNQSVSNLNYTNQDFYSMKSRLIDFIRVNFDTKFDDFIESDLAIMLIENWSFIADTLSFKIDQIANEVFIDTVTEVENAFRLAKLVGFNPTPPIAARSLWSVTINTPLTTDLVISTPLLTQAGNINIELFQSDANNEPLFNEPIIINAGSLTNDALIGLEGITVTDITSGNGEINQTVKIQRSPVIYGSIRVKVNGVSWEEVEYFTDSQPRREYRVEFNSEYQAFVIFGNNRAGLLPSKGSVIEVTHRIGGGEAGNIITGFIDVQKSFNVPNVPFKVPASFRNFTSGRFGYDGDVIEDIKRKLPQYIRLQNRAVTGLDYKYMSDLFVTPHQGQIGKSTAVLRNHGCAGNVVDLYVLARKNQDDLEEAGNELKVALEEEIDSKKMLTDYICIRDGSIILTDVTIDLVSDKINRPFEEQIIERVNRRINSFFKLTEWEFGDDLTEADIVKALADVKEIKSMDITFTTDDDDNSGDFVTARFFEIIRLDGVTINITFD